MLGTPKIRGTSHFSPTTQIKIPIQYIFHWGTLYCAHCCICRAFARQDQGLDLVLMNDAKLKVTDEGVLARITWVALDRETAKKKSRKQVNSARQVLQLEQGRLRDHRRQLQWTMHTKRQSSKGE